MTNLNLKSNSSGVVRRCTAKEIVGAKWKDNTSYFAEVPFEASLSSVAMSIAAHIAPKPN
jgi:hypothetical protein